MYEILTLAYPNVTLKFLHPEHQFSTDSTQKQIDQKFNKSGVEWNTFDIWANYQNNIFQFCVPDPISERNKEIGVLPTLSPLLYLFFNFQSQ